jgi:hypothetical protein
MLDPRIARILNAKTQPGTPPLPGRRVIAGYPRNADTVASLPFLEKVKLRLIADWIVECGQPGAYPVVKITAVGHAEASEAYAQAVSLKRASAVLEELRLEIRNQTKPPIGLNIPTLDTSIDFKPQGFGSIAGKRVVELVFERGQSVVRSAPPFFIMQLTDEVMRWAKYRFPPPPQPPLKWWKLPTVTHKDEWREIVNYIRNDTFLKYFDLKTIVEGMWDAAQGDPSLDPNASSEERQKAAEKWAEDLAEEWMKFNRDLQQRTANPPGDPEDPPEPTIVPPTRHITKGAGQQQR